MKLSEIQFDKKLWGSAAFFMIVVSIILSWAYVFIDGEPRRDDEYFHFKLAYNIRTEGWKTVSCFTPIYLLRDDGTCGRYEVNLYNLSLIPFTYIDDHLFALKVMNVFYAALTFTLLYVLMRKNGVRHAFLFALLLMTFASFVLRMLHGRAYVLVVVFVLWEMYFAVEKKYRALFILTLVHVMWHHATFMFPGIVVGIVEAVRYALERKIAWKNVGVVAGGVLCGEVIYPGFPGSFLKSIQGLFTIQQTATDATASASIVGSEMEKKKFLDYFANKTILLVMIVINACVAAFVYMSHRIQALGKNNVTMRDVHWTLSLFVFMCLVVGGNFFVTGRFDDFLVPVIGVLFAQVVTMFYDRGFVTLDKYVRSYAMAGVCIVLSVLLAQSLVLVRNTANGNRYVAAKHAAEWINDRSEPGERVFLHNWTDFTLMYFHNSKNVYSMGIEPTSIKMRDEALYWKYYNLLINTMYCDQMRDCKAEADQMKRQMSVMSPEEKAEVEKENGRKIIEMVKNDFKAKYIVTNSGALDQLLLRNPELIEDKWLNDGREGGMHHSAFELK